LISVGVVAESGSIQRDLPRPLPASAQRYPKSLSFLIRGSECPLQFARDHRRFCLLARERLESADIFLRPRTQLCSLRHLSSLPAWIHGASESAMAQRSNFLSAECNLRTAQHMDTQQCGQQHSEGNGGDARDAYLIHVALTHSRNDEDTLKAARRSLLCFDADSFFPIPPVASIRIFALVR
jgi:hypothetical protein